MNCDAAIEHFDASFSAFTEIRSFILNQIFQTSKDLKRNNTMILTNVV
jgi:hypothetical protein